MYRFSALCLSALAVAPPFQATAEAPLTPASTIAVEEVSLSLRHFGKSDLFYMGGEQIEGQLALRFADRFGLQVDLGRMEPSLTSPVPPLTSMQI